MQQLRVEIENASEEDREQLEHLSEALRREIAELDVDAVERPAAEPAPPGTKAGPGIDWSQLLVTLASPGSALVSVISAINGWIKIQGGRSVSVEIDGDRLVLTGVSSEDQKAVIQHWIERHQE